MVKRSKISMTHKKMYAIKKTKVGKRVVLVEEHKKTGKPIFASTKRAVSPSTKLFRLKSLAKKELMNERKRASFGASKSVKKVVSKKKMVKRTSRFGSRKTKLAPRKFGYSVCKDPEDEHKFKVFKFFPVKTAQGELIRVIIHKSRHTGAVNVLQVHPEAKVYNVKVTGTKSQVEASRKLAKAKADKLKNDYQILGYAGRAADLMLCGEPSVIQQLSKSVPKKVVKPVLPGLGYSHAKQIGEIRSLAMAGRDTEELRPRNLGLQKLGGIFDMGKDRIAHEQGQRLKGVPRNIFSVRPSSVQFGRNVNYGFSKYF